MALALEPLPARDVFLPSRPTLPLKVYSYDPPSFQPTDPLIIFINGALLYLRQDSFLQPTARTGMVAPMAGWRSVMQRLGGKYRLLAFDRYGQGQNAAARLEEPHDVVGLARYTGELIDAHLGQRSVSVPLVLVGNSIGCPIIRLLCKAGLPSHTSLAGVLFNDSMFASTDFVSLFPEGADDPGLAAAREGVRQVFHPTAKNKEGLDRSKLPDLLPDAGSPALPDEPYVTVLAQDHEGTCTNIGDVRRVCPGMTPELYLKYAVPPWMAYNQGLAAGLTIPKKSRGPITVPNSTHFIQMTRPDIVAKELDDMMTKIKGPPQPLPAHDVFLPSRPNLPLKVFRNKLSPEGSTEPLVCFVNGLMAPMAGWKMVIDGLGSEHRCLAFDRYGAGQGWASRIDDPHDILDLARYANELIDFHLGQRADTVPLVLVGNSIGCPLIRLMCQIGLPKHTTLAGVLFCDSMLANTDFVSLLPAPKEGEDPNLAAARAGMRQVPHPAAPNKEGLDRSMLPELLPHSDGPALPDSPYLTVLQQDHVLSAPDVLRFIPGLTAELYTTYLVPARELYNQGLARLTKPEKARGPIIVPNASHFIQLSRPDVITQELLEMLAKIKAV